MTSIDLFPAQSIDVLQASLQESIRSGTKEKVKKLLLDHPLLTNMPFSDGTLPLHLAVAISRPPLVTTILGLKADPLKRDGQQLDAFDYAAIVDNKKIAKTVLQTVTKETRSISVERLVIALHPRAAVRDAEALISDNALAELHLLLFFGENPNGLTKSGKTLFAHAAACGNIQAAYLLQAYGAKWRDQELTQLMAQAKKHDPLYISQADKWLLAATGAYWVARGLFSVPYLPEVMWLLGSRSIVTMGLELLPAANTNSRQRTKKA